VLAVLLIACLNVVNLMLTRATHREHEHVVRGALGARPFRLARQLFTESLVLGLLGAALGLGLAMILVDVLVALSPASIPRIEETAIDTRVLGFALALAVGVGIIVGLLPAFRVSRTDLARGLNVGSRGSSDMAHHGRIREALVVVQLALAVVLLVCGGLLLRSFASLLDAQAGFDRGGVLTFETQLPRSRYPDFQEKSRFYEEMLERIEALPGISSAGLTTYLPATEWMSIGRFAVDGYEPLPEEELLTEVQWVTPGYFTALRTSLLQGRMFEERDGQLSPADTTAEGKYLGANVVLINDWLARRYMRDGAAVGGRISYGDHWKAVVGVVADIRHRNIRRAGPQIYFPYPAAVRADMDVVVRTDSDPVSFVPTIRRLVASIDPEVVVYGALPLEDRLAGVVSEPRFRSLLLGLFAVAALLLAAIGVYGVMAYSVARRTRELAIRMALGADRTNVVQQVVLRGLTLAGIGLALGLIGAYVAAGSLQKYLFNLAPTDLLTFTTAALILTGVAILACWIPARRAAKVSPMTALRLE
jgi:putative ABC transport system permease protein